LDSFIIYGQPLRPKSKDQELSTIIEIDDEEEQKEEEKQEAEKQNHNQKPNLNKKENKKTHKKKKRKPVLPTEKENVLQE
jgi:hypothetical protein